MSFKDRARSLIASRHDKPIARRLARICEQYLNAYNNIANWNMVHNGELRALRMVLSASRGAVLDVGANEGQWATAVHPFLSGNPLHSFEPVPAIYAQLKQNMTGISDVTLVNAGLGAKAEKVAINYNPESSTISSAYPLIYGDEGSSLVECSITTGDIYIAKAGIDAVALLKIDVEGMEAECLAGFAQAFDRGKIAAVQFEHGPSHVHSRHTLKHFVDWFEDRGFVIHSIFPHGLKTVHYDILRESFSGQNYLALRRDMLGQFRIEN